MLRSSLLRTIMGATSRSIAAVVAVVGNTSAGTAQEKALNVFVSGENLTYESTEFLAGVAAAQRIEVKKGDTLVDIVKTACGGRDDKHYQKLLTTQSRTSKILSDVGVAGTPERMTGVGRDASLELPFCLKLPNTAAYRNTSDRGPNYPGIKGGTWSYGPLWGGVASAKTGYWQIPSGTGSPSTAGTNSDPIFNTGSRDVMAYSPGLGWAHTEPKWISGRANLDTAVMPPPYAYANGADKFDAKFDWSKFAAEYAAASAAQAATAKAPDYSGHVRVPLTTAIDEEDVRIKLAATLDLAIPADKSNKTPPSVSTSKADKKLQLISDLEDSAVTSACAGAAQDPGMFPFVLADVIRVLGLNKQVAKARHTPTAIVIADSGLFGWPRSPFSKDVHIAPTDFTDKKTQEIMAPVDGFGKRMHGTYVASAAIGSANLHGLVSLLDEPVKIHARNVVVGTGSDFDLSSPLIDNSFYKTETLGKIVNLSFKSDEKYSNLEANLSSDNGQLFVVAAGNDGCPLGQTSPQCDKAHSDKSFHTNLYPALYGGEIGKGHFNLIVVGALAANGALAKFSNYNPDHVEIAAPGCNIPVYEFGADAFKLTAKSGTSLAAPLVSFAAAMIYWHAPDRTPYEIKKRLLASADVVNADVLEETDRRPEFLDNKEAADIAKSELAALSGQIKHSRRLNLAKSIALYHDVIVTRSGSLMIGRIDEKFKPTFCNGSVQPDRTRLRKIVPRYVDADGMRGTLVYYEDTTDAKVLRHKICDGSAGPDADNKSFNFTHAESGLTQTFSLAEVRDVVFASLPQ